tara:strand:- start:17400 stop:17594 length:195 start_codon:yes stop_codon:yes gene_type:complete
MNLFYIIFRFIITLLLAFSASFLLDLELIYSNWVRYALVCMFIAAILIVGVKWVIIDIKKLSNN